MRTIKSARDLGSAQVSKRQHQTNPVECLPTRTANQQYRTLQDYFSHTMTSIIRRLLNLGRKPSQSRSRGRQRRRHSPHRLHGRSSSLPDLRQSRAIISDPSLKPKASRRSRTASASSYRNSSSKPLRIASRDTRKRQGRRDHVKRQRRHRPRRTNGYMVSVTPRGVEKRRVKPTDISKTRSSKETYSPQRVPVAKTPTSVHTYHGRGASGGSQNHQDTIVSDANIKEVIVSSSHGPTPNQPISLDIATAKISHGGSGDRKTQSLSPGFGNKPAKDGKVKRGSSSRSNHDKARGKKTHSHKSSVPSLPKNNQVNPVPSTSSSCKLVSPSGRSLEYISRQTPESANTISDQEPSIIDSVEGSGSSVCPAVSHHAWGDTTRTIIPCASVPSSTQRPSLHKSNARSMPATTISTLRASSRRPLASHAQSSIAGSSQVVNFNWGDNTRTIVPVKDHTL